MSPSRQSRVRGSLLGGAVGDALGAPIELDSLDVIRRRFGPRGLREPAPAFGRLGAITDDTQLSLFTAEGLIMARRDPLLAGRSGTVRSVHRAYLRWLRTQGEESAHPTFQRTSEGRLLGIPELHSRRGPGATCLAALRASRAGSRAHPINSSKDSGGVTRAAPVGLAPGIGDPFDVGCEIAALTHGHPTGYLAAGFLALAVHEVCAGAPVRAACEEAVEELSRHPGHEECRGAIREALRCAERGPPSPERLELLGSGWVAEEAVAIAICCACAAPDFETALRLSVNHGGDSDGTGAITGSLLGAARGAEAIPVRWLEVLELREEIQSLADQLGEGPGDTMGTAGPGD